MKKFLLIGASAAVALAITSRAEALTMSYVVCQGTACVTSSGSNTFSSSVGDYDFALGINTALNGTPTSNSDLLTATATRNANSSAAPLAVFFTVQGYTLPVSPQGYQMDTALTTNQQDQGGNPGRGLVSLDAWYSPGNNAAFSNVSGGHPPADGVLGNVASCTPLHSSTSDSCSNDPGPLLVTPGSSTYALVSETIINIGLNDTSKYTTTGIVSVTAVPEPGTMLLLGTGLLGIGRAIRRRMAA